MVVSAFDLGSIAYQQPEDLSTLPYFNMANWDYEECGTGTNPFGANYENMSNFVATWDAAEEGPGYVHKYYEMYYHLTLGIVTLQWHYENDPNEPLTGDTSSWPQINITYAESGDYIRCDDGTSLFGDGLEHYAQYHGYKYEDGFVGETYEAREAEFARHSILGDIIVVAHYDDLGDDICATSPQFVEPDPRSGWDVVTCASSTPIYPPDPGKPGKLSPPQPGYTVYSEQDDEYHYAIKDDFGSAWLDGPAYEAGADQESWNDALANGALCNFVSMQYSAAPQWRSGADRTGSKPNDWFIKHRAAYRGLAWDMDIFDAYPSAGNLDGGGVNQDFSNLGLTFDVDYAYFPNTHLSTRETFRWSDYPTVVDAGLHFNVQVIASRNNKADNWYYPITITQRLTFPDDYPIDLDDGDGDYYASESTPNQIDLLWEVTGDNETGSASGYTLVGGRTDLVLENTWEGGWYAMKLQIPYWVDYFNEYRTTPTETMYPSCVFFVDPQYFDGTLPPFGGGGASFFTVAEHWAQVTQSSIAAWQVVQWPEWHYWIPGGCPPHLRINQRQDEALGQRGNVPTTSSCNKAVRLIGRGEVDQNLTPGKSPRVYLPNSYF